MYHHGAMGRQKKYNTHLPPRMVLRHGAYYHTPRIDGRQQMVRLSSDFSEAMRAYYQREARTLAGSTVNDALSRYDREVQAANRYAHLSVETKRAALEKVFGA